MWTFPSEQLCLVAFILFFVLRLLALRFVRVAQLPDDLEMLLDEQRLGVRPNFTLISLFSLVEFIFQMFAPALRACLSSSDNQLKCFANVSENALLSAVDASVESLKQQLLCLHRQVKDVALAKLNLEESLKNGLEKYSIRKMATGSIDDFHKGLADRIGETSSRAFWLYLCAWLHVTAIC